MLHFYGEPLDRQDFDEKLGKCTAMIYRVSEDLLRAGNNVVLDFGFWSRTDRATVRQRFRDSGFDVVLVYFPIAIEEQLQRIQKRQRDLECVHFPFDLDKVKTLNTLFEIPGPDEETIEAERFGEFGT